MNIDLDPLPQWRKGKSRLRRSLDASFDVAATSAPPNTRSKDKEGPSTARRGREGTGKKDKERATLAGQKQSCGSNIKEQVRAHLERELEKKKKKEPPSRSILYLEAIKQAQEVVYKEYVASIPFTNNFEKNNVPDADVLGRERCFLCPAKRGCYQSWFFGFAGTQLWTPERNVSRKTIFV